MGKGTIIIGAGHAGTQLAATLRQEGYDEPVLLLSKETDFPYHRPPLSKTFLKAAEDKSQLLRAESFYRTNDIEFLPAVAAEAIDVAAHSVTLEGGEKRYFDKLVLATGATPRLPQVPGADLPGVVAIRTIDDSRRLRTLLPTASAAVIIGGGFIGLEIAATLAALGKNVTVLELADRLLGRVVSPYVSDHVLRRLSGQGIRFLLHTGVSRINAEGGVVKSVRTSAGEEIPAGFVVAGIGVDPNTRLAEEAGLACNNGILVNHALQTSHPDILAIGDCARYHHWHAARLVRLESVQNATDQARTAARTIIGRPEPYRAIPWFWSDIGDMKLQMVGLSFDADRHILVGSQEENAFSVYHFAGQRLLAIDSVNRPADHMLGRKMLGAGFSPTPDDVERGRVAEAFALAGDKVANDLGSPAAEAG
ncbi:3-phenylpropionate/trans-cinnamate dioxygenase ferredoxin reductase subunit [Mesorhizobium sp. J18]|uniref:NAD(P)/FAD-dependent oxidoreductase n=1 Tax=Mesorhizobium sp. J18 TaxID=935263 RepID=UPI00119AFC93|nr:FAD-dependent oxidoreductase [Mesorhizobium sp. J18]TWG90119.1 3-phenylpropionate/trans-cinnamate dioxygenase ferredoxin reductase subunit [Mesorhizobium sp. J18]